MPDVLRATIPRSADRCYQAFCDVRRLPDWVPGLRRARVVISGDDGLPREVFFEFGDKLSYSLLYTYFPVERRVEWRPGIGRRDAVDGWASFVPGETEGECAMSYALTPSGNSDAPERDPDGRVRLVAAFQRWMQSQP